MVNESVTVPCEPCRLHSLPGIGRRNPEEENRSLTHFLQKTEGQDPREEVEGTPPLPRCRCLHQNRIGRRIEVNIEVTFPEGPPSEDIISPSARLPVGVLMRKSRRLLKIHGLTEII